MISDVCPCGAMIQISFETGRESLMVEHHQKWLDGHAPCRTKEATVNRLTARLVVAENRAESAEHKLDRLRKYLRAKRRYEESSA